MRQGDRRNAEARPATEAGERERLAFAARILRMLADREAVRAGRIQVLRLDRIRSRLGDDWPKLERRVRDIASACLRHHLGPADEFLDVGDCCFVIVFADMQGERARLEVAALMHQVLARLFGDQAADDPEFRSFIGASAVSAEIDRGLAADAGTLLDDLGRRFDAAEAAEAATRQAAGTAPGSRIADADFERYFAAFQDGDRLAMPSLLSWRHRPLWDVPSQALGAYFCEIATARTDDGRKVDIDWIYRQGEDVRIGHLDAQTLAHVGQILQRLENSDRRCLLAFSIHAFTMEALRRRQAYLQQFQRLPEDHARFFVIEVRGLPRGMPPTRIRQLVADLRPHARLIVLRREGVELGSRLDPAGMRVLKDAGFDGAGFDARRLPGGDGALYDLMDRFAAACRAASLRACILGLKSRSQTLAAVTAGFDVIHSDAVMPSLASPGVMYRYGIDDLLAGLDAV